VHDWAGAEVGARTLISDGIRRIGITLNRFIDFEAYYSAIVTER